MAAMDQEKLKTAPVNNLDPDRSVGFINHERSIRGATQLAAASRAHVSGKVSALIQGEVTTGRFRKMSGPEGDMSKIMAEWKEKQDALAAEGLDSKTMSNLAVDRQRNNDLTSLKAEGGPFTTASCVDLFMASNLPDNVMNKRLYLEVRHARNTSLSFPKKSEIFRLRKNSINNLPTTTYATNLKAYLNKLSFHMNLCPGDFEDALDKMSL